MKSVLTILQDEDDDALSSRMEQAASTVLTPGDAPEEEEALSLVGRAERIFRHGRTPETAAPALARIYPDGYERRSPPQLYRVPEGYYRRLAWKAALYAVVAVLLLLLALELIKRKVLRF